MARYTKGTYNKLGKNFVKAIRDAQDTDDLINRILEPNTRKNTDRAKRYFRDIKRFGKPMNGYYGISNPVKLNISADTLKNIKPLTD